MSDEELGTMTQRHTRARDSVASAHKDRGVLLAEVERLRALEADAERALVKAELWNYYEAFVAANGAGSITELVVQRDEARAAVGAERAAVVAWLHSAADTRYYDCCCGPVAACADAIERGEHRREGGE